MATKIKKEWLSDRWPEIAFDPVKHKYYLDGQEIPSVTRILKQLDKPALVKWAANMTAEYVVDRIPDILAGRVKYSPKDARRLVDDSRKHHTRISEAGKMTGTAVHEAVEAYLKNGHKPTFDELSGTLVAKARKAFKAYLHWETRMNRGEVIETELPCYHPSYKYAGTVDSVMILAGVPWLVDFKTSKGIYPEMTMQVAAYLKMYNALVKPEEPVQMAGILRLDKETALPHWHPIAPGVLERSFRRFLALLDVWNLK